MEGLDDAVEQVVEVGRRRVWRRKGCKDKMGSMMFVTFGRRGV